MKLSNRGGFWLPKGSDFSEASPILAEFALSEENYIIKKRFFSFVCYLQAPCPETEASFPSRLTFAWMSRYIFAFQDQN